jgi:hypothetical protein
MIDLDDFEPEQSEEPDFSGPIDGSEEHIDQLIDELSEARGPEADCPYVVRAMLAREEGMATMAAPSPVEPPLGSPGAMAQAAETIRRFTPGPWRIEDPMGPETLSVVHGEGGPADWIFIAWVDVCGDDGEVNVTPEEGWANAALIARAPELLAEVERLRPFESALDELQIEAERIRAQVAAHENYAVRVQATIAQARQEADRLWEDLGRMTVARDVCADLCKDTERERDALADALEAEIAERYGGMTIAQFAKEVGDITLPPSSAPRKIMDALRACGRLPKGETNV